MAKLEKKYCVNCGEDLEPGEFNSEASQNNMFMIPFCKNPGCFRYGLLSTAYISEKAINKFRKDLDANKRKSSKDKKN